MIQFISTHLAVLVSFLVLDGIWLGWIAKDFFQKELSSFMIDSVNIPVALLFYVLYVVGIIIFVINPELVDGNWKTVFAYGALFGFICYATYDMTNLATLKDWPIRVVVVDMLWGGFVTGAAATVGYWVAQLFSY